jgi:hypothetical protein
MKNLEPDLLAALTDAPATGARKRSRTLQAVAVTLGVAFLLGVACHFVGDALLNRYLVPRLERAFSAHLPGATLHVGALSYDFWRNRLRCDELDLHLPNGAAARTGSITVTGVNWARLRSGQSDREQAIRNVRIQVTELSAVLPTGEYRVHCASLAVAIPEAEVVAQAITVQPVASDEAFFAATDFRRARCRVALASCTLRGVGFADLLTGRGYRARSIELTGPVFDALVDREKPRRPPKPGLPMPHEALAAVEKPFRIDQLAITDGLIRYAGRRAPGAGPGVLSFSEVQIAVKDIANAAAGGDVIGVMARGRLMDAGALTVEMRIPVAPGALAFHYAGKLEAMDLTQLDDYLDGAARFQITSGSAHEALFDIDVVDGHARGVLRGRYRDLQVKLLDQNTGSDKGVTNRVGTVLANQLKVRRENAPDKAGVLKEGKVDYVRKPEDNFLQFAWMAVRSGVLDLIKL